MGNGDWATAGDPVVPREGRARERPGDNYWLWLHSHLDVVRQCQGTGYAPPTHPRCECGLTLKLFAPKIVSGKKDRGAAWACCLSGASGAPPSLPSKSPSCAYRSPPPPGYRCRRWERWRSPTRRLVGGAAAH